MWVQMAKFNAYSFCKAHAASYGILAYQLAYLKAHYPLEFMTAALNHQWGMYPKRVHVEEARRLGLRVLPPCVNHSERQFAIEDGAIRVGLEQVKGLTQSGIEAILRERGRRPFDCIPDFIERVRIGRKEVEDLVLCGAFDFTGRTRPQGVWEVKTNFDSVRRFSRRSTLFATVALEEPPDLKDYSIPQKLKYEYEILEMFLSCHPMALFRSYLEERGFIRSDRVGQKIGKHIRVAGILSATRVTETKGEAGDMEFLTLEDESGLVEVTLFPRVYKRFRHIIEDLGPYLIRGKVENQYGSLSVNAVDIRCLTDPAVKSVQTVNNHDGTTGTTYGRKVGQPSLAVS